VPRPFWFHFASFVFSTVITASAATVSHGDTIDRPFASSALSGQKAYVGASYSCAPRRTCSRIRSCEEAEWYLANCSWGTRLDGDGDGVPCEKLCR
jgi:hypothetical protein